MIYLLTRLRSWNFFLEDLQSVRVLMVMRVQKIWKNVIVERLSGQSASAEKKTTGIKVVKHLAILELQQFRMMQLPIIIIDDILHAPESSGIGMAANGTP